MRQWKMAYVFHRYDDTHKHMMQFAASHHSQSPSQKMSREKWFANWESSNLHLSQTVSNVWINPLFVWKHNYHLLFLCGSFPQLNSQHGGERQGERGSVLKEFRISPWITQTMTTVTEGRNLCRVMNRWCRPNENNGRSFDWESGRKIIN